MLINGNEIFVGCDPEVFVIDKKTKNFVSGHGLILGTKQEPLRVKHGMVQVDGMALEFGIDPAKTEDEFVSRISLVMETLKKMLPKGLELAVVPIASFSEEIMQVQPREALDLGCDPDYNAYTLALNPSPQLPKHNIRSAGGHVHIGFTAGAPPKHPEHLKACAVLAAEMDYQLGVPSLSWDNNIERRKIYGGPGAFRPKPYGMEYRTLSNQWLLSEDLMRYVYRKTILSVSNVLCLKHNFNKEVFLYNNSISFYPKEAITNNFELIGRVLKEELF
jgi:hypothetical protein